MQIQSKLTDSTLLQVQQLVTYEGLDDYSCPEIWCSYLHKRGHVTLQAFYFTKVCFENMAGFNTYTYKWQKQKLYSWQYQRVQIKFSEFWTFHIPQTLRLIQKYLQSHLLFCVNKKLGLILRDGHSAEGIFRTGRGEGTGGWRRLHNEKLHNLYSLPNSRRAIKLKMWQSGHVAKNFG